MTPTIAIMSIVNVLRPLLRTSPLDAAYGM
jgi:hypothetical protein